MRDRKKIVDKLGENFGSVVRLNLTIRRSTGSSKPLSDTANLDHRVFSLTNEKFLHCDKSTMLVICDLYWSEGQFTKPFVVLRHARLFPISRNSVDTPHRPKHQSLFCSTRDRLNVATGSAHFPAGLYYRLPSSSRTIRISWLFLRSRWRPFLWCSTLLFSWVCYSRT